jgi:excisionase family DNA binding protein
MAATLSMESGQNGPRLGRSVSIDQAAQLLQVSRRTIYNRIRDGRLVTIRTIGGSQRVLLESLHELGSSSQMLPSPMQSFAVRPATGN